MQLTPYWPQIAIITLSLWGLFNSILNLQSTKPQKISAVTLLVLAGQLACFWFAGVVKFTWPFCILVTLIVSGLALTVRDWGQPQKPRSLTLVLIVFGLIQGLYYWMGFYDIFLK